VVLLVVVVLSVVILLVVVYGVVEVDSGTHQGDVVVEAVELSPHDSVDEPAPTIKSNFAVNQSRRFNIKV
jgi:hypothetical protein